MTYGPYTLGDVFAVFIGMSALIVVGIISYPFIVVYKKIIKPRMVARKQIKHHKAVLKKAVEEIEHERRLRRET